MEDFKEIDIGSNEVRIKKDGINIKTQDDKISIKGPVGDFKVETPDSKIEARDQKIIIKERKEKVVNFLKNPKIWVVCLVIIAVILGVYIRSLPMHVRPDTGKPGLWDFTKNNWTLGPDLDPWLFTRYAKTIVEEGGLPEVDKFRYVPLGYEPSRETRLLPYMIAWTHSLVGGSVEYAAALFPVIMFGLTILVFFLFVREIFIYSDKKKRLRANIIALISTFLMIVIPVFISRTIAGIPEKESAGFFFMFLAFYLFLKAWRIKNIKKSLLFGIGAGIATGLMGLIWGGMVYVFVAISVSSLIAFALGKVKEKEIFIYFCWFISSTIILLAFSARFSLLGLIKTLYIGFSFFVAFLFIIHLMLWKTKLSKNRLIENIKLPKNFISVIFAIIAGIILVSILFGPGFIFSKISELNQALFTPVTGRWKVTVAENNQPYFIQWGKRFGPYVKNIPVLFWLFFIGSIFLFKKMLKPLRKKDGWILTGLYILFFIGLVFSRYSSNSVFNGTNFLSKFFYYGSALLFLGVAIHILWNYSKQGNYSFKKINYNYLFLFTLFILCLITARSAVRLIMILAPVSVIFAGFLAVKSFDYFREVRDSTWKIVVGTFMILVLISTIHCFIAFYKESSATAKGMIPSYYNQQWQEAMAWVRDETPENSVFAHWWDYGYWVQSIGERATVLDGSNSIVYWNYLMGRLVLTGDNQKDALDFLYSHNATHLLIDSSDIGKYGAYSSIGSNKEMDRYSGISSFVSKKNQIHETSDGIIKIYQLPVSGGYGIQYLDEDINYELNGTNVFLPQNRAGVVGFKVEIMNNLSFKQPTGVYFYNGIQYEIPIRYIEYNGEFYDFGSGLEATLKIIKKVEPSSTGLTIDDYGTLIYISPKVLRGLMAQIYLLDDPFGNFPAFVIKHTQDSLAVKELINNGVPVHEFVDYYGIQGPIKIWEIQYTGEEVVKEEYLDTDYSKYIDWKL